MTPLRIGVTGSGFMGRTHAEAARRLETTRLVAVAGGSRAPRLARDYGIDCETDAAALAARDDIDAVVLATPHYRHCEEALCLAAAGKHVLVEKPMATSVGDCRRMIEACRKAGTVISVGYHQRFRESNRRVRDLIQAGAIGRVHCVQMSALFDIEALRNDNQFGGDWGWWKDPQSVAHLLNSGPHNIDLCRWWLGQEVVSVAARSGTFREDNPNENTTMGLIGFDGGAMGTFWSSSVLPSPGFPDESFRFRVMGQDGLLDVNPYGDVRLASDREWQTVYRQPTVDFDDPQAAFGSTNRMQAYCDQMAAFVESVRGHPGGEGTAKDGLKGVEVVIAMLDSAATGRMIHLPC